MSFYKISPTLTKELKSGQFLKPPTDGQLGHKVTDSADPDFPQHVWREVFVIRDVAVKADGDQEYVQVTLTVPSDVVSPNQGRTATTSMFFPWKDAEKGDKKAQGRCSMNFRDLMALLSAIGWSGDLTSLADVPVATMRNMRISAQVKLAPDKELIPRQNIGYFRAPK